MELVNPTRRGLLKGLGLLIAAPAIVRVASLMPVKAIPHEYGIDFRHLYLTDTDTWMITDGWYRIGTALEYINVGDPVVFVDNPLIGGECDAHPA